MKVCNKCKISKELIFFSKKKDTKDGLNIYCKFCKSIEGKNYYNINNIKKKKYIQDNITKKREWDNNYRLREDIRIKKNNYLKEYNQENKIKLNEYHKKRRYIRYRTDINFKLTSILRGRLGMALKGKIKKEKTLNLLGCSIEELKQYLEKQFINEMSWSNHGLIWEIDHIIPCSLFDLTKLEEQQKCFHYSNLQPLYKLENRIKSNKL